MPDRSRLTVEMFLAAATDDSKQHYPGKLSIKKFPGLSQEQRLVEARAAVFVETNLEPCLKKYRATHGNKLNTDDARELFAEYTASLETRAKFAAAVQEPAGALIKELWKRMLKEPDLTGEQFIIFTAGGGGAGKSTATDIPLVNEVLKKAHIIYDTTMASLESSKKKLEEAFAAGKRVLIFYVHRPFEKAVQGVIQRAIRSGRTIPADVLASDHYHAPRTVLQLAADYAGDNRIRIGVIDNSGELEDSKLVSVDFLAENLYTSIAELRKQAEDILLEERRRRKGNPHESQIETFIIQGIIGQDPNAVGSTAGPSGPVDGLQSSVPRPEGKSGGNDGSRTENSVRGEDEANKRES